MAVRAGAAIVDWQLSTYFGWGLIGVNLMLNWSMQNTGLLLTTMPVREAAIDISPIEWALIGPAVQASRELQTQLQPFGGQYVSIDFPVLHALGNDFIPHGGAVDVQITGSPNVAMPYFEQTPLSAERRERLKTFSVIVAGSTWNRMILDAAAVAPVELALQGVDDTVFHPAPAAGWFRDRFAVFSGGKLEYRKGQDLVLKAFAAFAARHRDAVLVTAWASPWPEVARSFDVDRSIPAVPLAADGRLDVTAWAVLHGIAPEQLIVLDALPNHAFARLYREMHVAVFPNRCEGGTNLVAMECMACGVPVILSRNTGHLDLIAPDRCFALDHQSVIDGAGHEDWGESDVEDIVETLEAVYLNRSRALASAARAAQFMTSMTWADTVRRLSTIIATYA